MLPRLQQAAARSTVDTQWLIYGLLHGARGGCVGAAGLAAGPHSASTAAHAVPQAHSTAPAARRHCAAGTNLQTSQQDWRTSALDAANPGINAGKLLVDTLAMMQQYEDNGLSRGQAEAVTRHVTDVLLSQMAFNDLKYVPQAQLERTLIEWKADQRHLQQEVMVRQEVHVAVMGKDTERLQAQLDKFKADIKHEVDKLTANQKLDLNLERGRMRDEMQQVRDKVFTLHSGIEKEINSVRTEIETSKSETLKWVVVTVGGLLGAGFAAIRLSLAV